MTKNNKHWLYFFGLIAIELFQLIYFDIRKEAFFIDEVWSYTLANSYYFPQVGEAAQFFGIPLDSDFWVKSLTVNNEDSIQVELKAGLIKDNLPPLIDGFLPDSISSKMIMRIEK